MLYFLGSIPTNNPKPYLIFWEAYRPISRTLTLNSRAGIRIFIEMSAMDFCACGEMMPKRAPANPVAMAVTETPIARRAAISTATNAAMADRVRCKRPGKVLSAARDLNHSTVEIPISELGMLQLVCLILDPNRYPFSLQESPQVAANLSLKPRPVCLSNNA